MVGPPKKGSNLGGILINTILNFSKELLIRILKHFHYDFYVCKNFLYSTGNKEELLGYFSLINTVPILARNFNLIQLDLKTMSIWFFRFFLNYNSSPQKVIYCTGGMEIRKNDYVILRFFMRGVFFSLHFLGLEMKFSRSIWILVRATNLPTNQITPFYANTCNQPKLDYAKHK